MADAPLTRADGVELLRVATALLRAAEAMAGAAVLALDQVAERWKR